ncbi:MAG: tetratricopeptide repeat protein [Opitutaceae bacterium]|nr:tetratricopeptide repeat protein [Opitutaceae bacterium]
MSPARLQQLLNEGLAHHRAGRLHEAARLYDRARAAAPRQFDVLHLSGVLAYQQGRIADALDQLTRARQLNPRSAPCAMRLGLALVAAGRKAEAEVHLRAAVELQPDFHEAWDNLAYCLKTQDRLQEAVGCHARVVALQPGHAQGWYNYGLTLSLLGAVTDALACHDRALAADPRYAKAHYGRAQALQQAHRIPEAIEAYGRYLEREPQGHEARSYRLFALNNLDGLTREQLFAEHLEYGRAVGERPAPHFPQSPDPGRRLRVAVLSPDLRAHSCAYFLEPLLRHLDPARYELYLYHDHFREDAVSARLRSLAAVWRNFVGQSAAAFEQAVRADQPDILIDLAGHTGMTNRLPLFARHLAPVQVTYLGYPNTTGLRAMGWRLTDAIADPEGEADAFATERLVRFAPTAWAYEPPANAPLPNEPPASAGGPLTFGCFNNLTKVTDRMLAVWARLLAAVPDSRLVLKGRGLSEAAVRGRYLARFAACGLPAERVDLLERTAETAAHLALYHHVDIALDCFPYHGTTTTCEALWMGVPVVTLLGDRHVSRVSASLLTAVGRPEWIAGSDDDYVRIAAGLAADRAGLRAIRAGLRDEMRRSPLLDHAAQSARFAAALRGCWQQWCATQASLAKTG